jgi:hypothetical protein
MSPTVQYFGLSSSSLKKMSPILDCPNITSLSCKCSSLQQEVRGFSSFALFFDWAGGFDQVMSALPGDIHCF